MLKTIPLKLGIARSSGNSDSPKIKTGGMSLVLTAELRAAVFSRDENTCRCCGFTSGKYQDVHFIDQNRQNLAMDNLATVCIFCHQCFNLDQTTLMRSGVLVWLPEISQTDLHHIMRSIYVARISQGPMAEAARAALDTLMARREEARRRVQTDDPYVLSTVLKDFLTNRHYAERGNKLEGIRLMPLDRRLIRETDLEFNQFPQILAYWRSKDGPFGTKLPTLWTTQYKAALRAVT